MIETSAPRLARRERPALMTSRPWPMRGPARSKPAAAARRNHVSDNPLHA